MIGLDRTDAGPVNKEGTATVEVSPCPDVEPYYVWQEAAGVCVIPAGQPSEGAGLASVTYQTVDKEACSAKYMDQEVAVDVSPVGSVSAKLFTVVKLDVSVGGTGEDNEETKGAFVSYEADTNGTLSVRGTAALQPVSIRCFPDDLPEEERVTVSVPSEFLLEKVGDQYVPAQAEYKANEIGSKQFYLHGHEVSGSLRDREIEVTHGGSGAKDKVKFTVFNVEKRGVFWPSLSEWTMKWESLTEGAVAPMLLKPDPQGELAVEWRIYGLPSEGTEILWSSSKAHLGYPEVGTGASPSLSLRYSSETSLFNDVLPPDKRWFGEKLIKVQIDSALIIECPITLYFNSNLKRTGTSGWFTSIIISWYSYYVADHVVEGLDEFKYDDTLGYRAEYNQSYNSFKIGPEGNALIDEPYITSAKRYAERPYQGHDGVGCHAVAKTCAHEKWHQTLRFELEYMIPDPMFPIPIVVNDYDGDGLPNGREIEIGADPYIKDSFGFCDFDPGFPATYTGYADNEVFCRLKEVAVRGDEESDWAFWGAKGP
jgi:hypothetical protein